MGGAGWGQVGGDGYREVSVATLVSWVTILEMANRSFFLISYRSESAWNWTISFGELTASWTSFTQRHTTLADSGLAPCKRIPETRAEEATSVF